MKASDLATMPLSLGSAMRADRLATSTRRGRFWQWQVTGYKRIKRTRCLMRFCGCSRFAVKALERASQCVRSILLEQGVRVIAVSVSRMWGDWNLDEEQLRAQLRARQ